MKSIYKALILFSVVPLSACGSFASKNMTSSSDSSVLSIDSIKMLRSPENADHSYSFQDLNSSGYKEFKTKIKVFAEKISESFVKREHENDNIVISPASIELALGLAVKCSNGQTREEILNAFDVDYETFNNYYKIFYNTSMFKQTYEGGPQLSYTNSLWFDNDLQLHDDCLDELKDDYYSYSYEVDFDGDNKAANQAIQQFINEKTNGLLNPDLDISTQTIFALFNTLYLKDLWWNKYHEESLGLAPENYTFTNFDGSVSPKRLLNGFYHDGRVMETDDYSAFYTSSQHCTIYFLKPKNNKDVNQIFNQTNIDYVLDYSHYQTKDDEKLERYHTNCVFPEIEAQHKLDLTEMMRDDFDMKSLFTYECNMSTITPNPAICTGITHESKLTINQQGIEGAAYTGILVAGDPGPDEYTDVYETFVVDEEFAFFVTRDSAILFSGIVSSIDTY